MSTNYDGVKFFGIHDMSRGYYLKKAESVLDNYNQLNDYNDINQVIELFNIKQFLDNGLHLATWDDTVLVKYKEKSKTIPQMVGKFFSKIDSTNLAQYYDKLSIIYIRDFWNLICKNNVFERVEKRDIFKLLRQGNISLWHILEQQKIVKYFGQEIAGYMKIADESAELLMDQFLSDRRDTQIRYYFPDELTQNDRNEILKKYVESESANPNYLKLLVNAQGSMELPVGDRLRRDAKSKFDEYWSNQSQPNAGIEFGAEVSFVSMPNDKITETFENNIIKATYSKEWIQENLDYPTLLNNFIYLFEYTDKWFRCNFLSTSSKMSALEKVLGVKGKRDYRIGTYFTVQRLKTCIQMLAYMKELEIYSVRIESIFQWFFEVYLINEFHVSGFIYNTPSEKTTTFEKCKLLASAIDGVLKQYKLFCEDGYIDRDLLEMSSGHIDFSELRSMQNKKYAYSNSDAIINEQFLLYSDQSHLTYTEKTQSKYHSFSQMILNENMVLDDFAEYQKPNIIWLINRESLIQNGNNILSLNISRAFILGELFEREVICPLYCGEVKPLIEELQRIGDIRYENTIFSKPEQDYLNYMLNKKEFSNGYDLRNRYIHDTYSLDPDIQQRDYLEFLKIMVLIIIKINEELCLREDLRK